MQVKIMLNTWVDVRKGEELKDMFLRKGHMERSQVWSGELDIIPDNVYITSISILAEGVPHPICDIPFSIESGYWYWMPMQIGEEDSEIPANWKDGLTEFPKIEESKEKLDKITRVRYLLNKAMRKKG